MNIEKEYPLRLLIQDDRLNENYLIVYKVTNARGLIGVAFPVVKYIDGSCSDPLLFQSKTSSDSVTDIQEARSMFMFDYQWRGAWCDHIQFTDDDYNSFEFKTLYDLWQCLQPALRLTLQQFNPEYISNENLLEH